MQRRTSDVVTVLILISASYTWAAKPGQPAFTDPEKAGADFAVQGEYLGKVEGKKAGGHIIALGDGKFKVIGYHGGLPGDGWSRDQGRELGVGETKDGVTTFREDKKEPGWTAKLAGDVLTVYEDDKEIGKLEKVERKSPTLGAKPPKGAIVLFDGNTADNFENGKIVENEYLAASNCASKQKLGDHKLHLEFRTPFMPKSGGQGRGNSGVYVQGRYEVQVLDSFALEGKNNECGGIYSIAEPKVNMCYPPLSWQTYDMDFTAARYDDTGKKTKTARITVRHNGVVIHDDIELTHGTPGRNKEGPEPDALFLQDHGNPVVYRNIWVVEQ